MFTGIITNIGEVKELRHEKNQDLLIKISIENEITRGLDIGCSIACNGICLTLIAKEIVEENKNFFFQASKETQDKTNLKNWKVGDLINLEFSLRIGDELGGHMVLGHVDDCAKIVEIKKIDESSIFIFETKKELMKFIAKKGSVTINGVSLTVNEVYDNSFAVNIIPHTLENTNFCNSKIGDLVNLEVDMMARYLERLNYGK